VDASCPFCGAVLRDVPAPLAFAGILLGLSLMGCGDDTATDEGADSGSASNTVSATNGESSSAETGSTTAEETMEGEAADYGGPEATFEETAEPEESGPQPESSSDDTGTTTTGSTDDSGTSDTSGTDTGATTTDSSAEGADYGAAPPQNPH
jgi:hypothetical protein